MKNRKMYYLPAIVLGLIIGCVMVAGAFTEPTSSPTSMVSYPPINVGLDTQLRDGAMSIGDGTHRPASAFTNGGVNSVAITSCDDADIADNKCDNTPTTLGVDNLVVQRNANFVGNVNIGGRAIIAGALRIGQSILYTDKVHGNMTTFISSQNLNSTGFNYTDIGLYFPSRATTNLGQGNWCTTAANTACPSGTVLYRYDTTTYKATCRAIDPAKNPGNAGSCYFIK
jgi:hypothetical protein